MIQTDLIASIPVLLRRHAEARGSKVAYRDASRAVTYQELQTRTGNLAGHLADHGIRPSDKVAIFLPNSVAWIESCFAINRAGAISVPISYDATESEVLYRLQDAACTAIITTDERAALLAKLKNDAPALKIEVLSGPAAGSAAALRYEQLAGVAPKSAPRDPSEIFDPAFIIYTSGTTGRAKGVLLSVHSMLWVNAACWAPIAGLSEADVVLSPLPLFHSYALNLSVLSILAVGATEYIMEKYSTSEAVRLLKSGEFTIFPGVPTMFHYFLEATKDDPALKLPNLRLSMSAGAIMPATLNREFEARFGVKLLDGYGITETSTMVTMNWPVGARVMGSCGLPLPGLAVRIISPATGEDVPFGEEGELIVRGPNLMSGYHNKPEETASALRKGWYHTGDLARSDRDGFLTITGRLKELIIRGGQNIAPAEIEEAVNILDDVVDNAVVGIPHAHLGEVPALFVVAREGSGIAAEQILEHCRGRLSSYKVPFSVHFVTEIPRTGSGKIIRFKLRETLIPPINKAM
ncbi:MAG: acyl--CoA ligase [Afipia sp.]|nr:acyl--CoA ligase [Afipia sp.]